MFWYLTEKSFLYNNLGNTKQSNRRFTWRLTRSAQLGCDLIEIHVIIMLEVNTGHPNVKTLLAQV